MKSYAGIGSRKTPKYILEIIQATAKLLAVDGYTCHTGAATGADQAFAEKADTVHLFLPWPSYEKVWVQYLHTYSNVETTVINNQHTLAFASVDEFHPNPSCLTPVIKKLHARNYLIIEGCEFIVCWTPKGETTGGTGQAIRIAKSLDMPVYNLGNPDTLTAFKNKIAERYQDLMI